MNRKEVFGLFFGVIGLAILRVTYLGDPIPSPSGLYDLKPIVFGFGLLFISIFGFFLGQENR